MSPLLKISPNHRAAEIGNPFFHEIQDEKNKGGGHEGKVEDNGFLASFCRNGNPQRSDIQRPLDERVSDEFSP
jgi:hypothetical protein